MINLVKKLQTNLESGEWCVDQGRFWYVYFVFFFVENRRMVIHVPQTNVNLFVAGPAGNCDIGNNESNG
jgi:hypothetical protein